MGATVDQVHYLHTDDNRRDTRLVAHTCSQVAENLAPDSCKSKMSVIALTLLAALFSNHADPVGSCSSIYV
jgi:hypothetical protein